MATLRLVAVVATLAAFAGAEISNHRALDSADGARCWGPGVWPHPRHCRLFSVCRLQEHEVVGHLVACPVGTGFSSRHLRCVDAAMVPGCGGAPPPGALRSVLVLSSNATRRHQCSYDGVSYCETAAVLVVCAPNQRLLGRVDCTDQQASTSVPGRCDQHEDATCLFTAQEPSDLLALEDKSMGFELDAPIAAPIADADADADADVEGEATTPAAAAEGLPQVACQRAGLHCVDAKTLADCEEVGSAPVFSISCAEVMTSDSREASGRCVAGVCQLALDGLRLNLELATLDFGDDDDADADATARVSALLDEDDDADLPEMMDGDLLRGSPTSGWGWFRNSAETEDAATNATASAESVEESAEEAADSAEAAARNAVGSPLSWRAHRPDKVPRVVRVPSENATATARFAERCALGGLVCLDAATLVACSGDNVDTPTYAILCAGTARGGNATLTARCDLESDSCQLDLD